MMVEQQYISSGLPHPAPLSGPPSLSESCRSSVAPSTSAYPDLTPYSALSAPTHAQLIVPVVIQHQLTMNRQQVSSFNLPTQCDTSLLTPISSAGSPPLHHSRKLARQYPPPPGTPHSQQPSPPASSKMYHQWSNHFDVDGQPSQAGSPMTTQTHVNTDYYMSDERRTPGPPEPYMGAFGVSDGPNSHPMNPHGGHSYYVDMSQIGSHNSLMMRDNDQMHMGSQVRDMERHGTPLLHQPNPSHFHQPRRSSTDEQPFQNGADANRSLSGSPRRRSVVQGNSRVKKSKSKRQSSSARGAQHIAEANESNRNCLGEEVPPILKDNCPEEERCIFDSRWRHRNQRGQDMWESIQSDFERAFNKTNGKEMLQMKFRRGRTKYMEWLPKDEEILRAAWVRLEKQRYHTLLDIFHEMGGSQNMLLCPTDVEAKVVVDLRLEEHLYMGDLPDMEVRRRRKAIVKKKPHGRGSDESSEAPAEEMVTLTPQMEDEVINQVHGRRDARWDEDSSAHSDMMDVQMWDSRAPMKLESPGPSGVAAVHQRSNQVARQACDQILKANGNNANGVNRPTSNRKKGAA